VTKQLTFELLDNFFKEKTTFRGERGPSIGPREAEYQFYSTGGGLPAGSGVGVGVGIPAVSVQRIPCPDTLSV
jgi:hypothetical protein